MALIKKISRVSDLPVLSRITSDGQLASEGKVILAQGRKNYTTSLQSIKGNKIVKMMQVLGKENNGTSIIRLYFENGNTYSIIVRDGSIGDQGPQGEKGIIGPRGKDITEAELQAIFGTKANLIIVNDYTDLKDLTDEERAVLDDTLKTQSVSALQGKQMYDVIDNITETIVSEEAYNRLFTDLSYIDIEYTTNTDNETVVLVNADNATHVRYRKYWTYENEGTTTVYIYNSLSGQYDEMPVDMWADIYLGSKAGYFRASQSQLTDGTVLYVNENGTYKEIELVKRPAETAGGEPVYTGAKRFDLYDTNLLATIHVEYDDSNNKYKYNLTATEIVPELYVKTGADEYALVADINSLNSLSEYYKKNDDGTYTALSFADAQKYVKTPDIRYYVKAGDGWKEVKDIDDVNTAIFQEYIMLTYTALTNTYSYTRYEKKATFLETYYVEYKSSYANNTIQYYVYETDRKYYKRVPVYDGAGNMTYNYVEIKAPIWIDCVYTTTEEDWPTRIITAREVSVQPGDTTEEQDKEIITPIYIKNMRVTDANGEELDTAAKPIEIAYDAVGYFNVDYSPADANQTMLTIEYDPAIIRFYEDGRIAAVMTPDMESGKSVDTVIKVSTDYEDTPNVSVECHIRIVMPVRKIVAVNKVTALYSGQEYTLSVNTLPENATNHDVIWESNDPATISVTADGKIKALGASGEAVITCTAADGYNAYLEFPVTISKMVENLKPLLAIPVYMKKAGEDEAYEQIMYRTEIKAATDYYYHDDVLVDYMLIDDIVDFLNYHDRLAFIEHDETNKSYNPIKFTIDYDVIPDDATIRNLSWESNNAEYLSIDEYDYIVPNKVTEDDVLVKITGTTTDNSNKTLAKEYAVVIPVTSMTVQGNGTPNKITVAKGNEASISVVVGPSDASNKRLIWRTNNDNVILDNVITEPGADGVTHTNFISAKKDGDTVISVMAEDMYMTHYKNGAGLVELNVTVTVPVTEIRLYEQGNMTTSITSMNVFAGGSTKRIIAEVYPTAATNQTLTWRSANDDVAIVSPNGTVTGVSEGRTIILCSANDESGTYATCIVNVLVAVSEIILNAEAIEIENGKTFAMVANVTPENATDQRIIWSSADENVVTVDMNGVLTAVSEGETTITCTAADGSAVEKTATVVVKAAEIF